MRQRIYMILVVSLLCTVMGLKSSSAQITVPTISGMIVDEFGRPLAGVLACSENRQNQKVSALDGTFYLSVDDNSGFVRFSFPGYLDRIVESVSASGLRIEMVPDIVHRDEVIDLGYTRQRKNAVTGAVSSVRGEQLEPVPSSNVKEKMLGMFSGLGYRYNTFELPEEGIDFLIRGFSSYNEQAPTIILDGVLLASFSNTDFKFITAEEIESISVIKDAAFTSIYGIQSRGGVISIRTKRGYSGDLRVRVTVDQSFQQMTKTPEYINSAQYVRLRNWAGYNDTGRLYTEYAQQEVEKFTDGSDRVHYPDNDWRKMFLKEWAYMQKAGVNVSGGNDAVKYYSNINFMRQTQPFKIEEKDQFNPTPSDMWFNFRTNVDVKINKYISGFINLGGSVKRQKWAGGYNHDYIYNSVFSLPPTMYGPLTPEVVDPDNPEKTLVGQVVATDKITDPVYAQLNRRGYYVHQNINIMSQAGVTGDLGFITKGLSISGMMAYQTSSYLGETLIRDYARYVRSSNLDELDFSIQGTSRNGYLQSGKAKDFSYNVNLKANMDYGRTFGSHEVSAMAYVYYQKEDPQRTFALPLKRQSLGVSAFYGYRDTYFVKADMGYSGSDQFHPDRRFTATPAVSAAWVISNENFMSTDNVFTYLKLRSSYGVIANDWFGNARFVYMDDHRSDNGYDGRRGNPYIKAEKMKMFNVGLDLGLWNTISVQFDYFRSHGDNLFTSGASNIPVYQGIDLGKYPYTNSGEMKNYGFEASVNYMKRINPDWTVFAGGNFSFSRNKVIDTKEASKGNDYAYPLQTEGFRYQQQWGYVVDMSNGNGFYNTDEELAAALPHSFGTPRLGDLIYRDLNGDGEINEKDRAPIGLSVFPEIYYGLSAGFSYRNLDFSFMIQGTGNVTRTYANEGFYDYMLHGIYNDIHLTAWTKERYQAGEKITAPALSLTESVSSQPNTFWNMNSAVIRLKNVEIGYTVPLKWSGVEKIRFNLRGHNLVSINDLPTKNLDPEAPSYTSFQPWRTYSIGVGITF